jgi:hypothetical protein
MTKIKCMLCGMVLEEEDYSIPLMRPRKRMDEQPVFFECICQRCKKSIDRAMIEYERKEHDEDDNNKNNTRIC